MGAMPKGKEKGKGKGGGKKKTKTTAICGAMSSQGNQADLKRTRFSMELFVKLQSM